MDWLRRCCTWRRLTACVFAGLVLQTGLAWGFTLYGDRPWNRVSASILRTQYGWELSGRSEDPATVGGEIFVELMNALPRTAATGYQVGLLGDEDYCQVTLGRESSEVVSFTVLTCYSNEGNTDGALEIAAGWPFRSLSCSYCDSQFLASWPASMADELDRSGGWNDAIDVRVTIPPGQTWQHIYGGCMLGSSGPKEPTVELRPLPLRPLVAGLVGNTAVFAGAVWLQAAVPTGCMAYRRRALRRAGLCLHCRYEVRDLPRCPECGGVCGPAN